MADLDLTRNSYYRVQGLPDAIKMSQLSGLLQDALISTDHVQQCAIIRRQDGDVKASSVGFNLHPGQIATLLDAFKSPSQSREEGIYYDEKQYRCVRADSQSIYAKSNKSGLVLVKTVAMLIVATYTENMFPSVCVEAVEKLADYFRDKGT